MNNFNKHMDQQFRNRIRNHEFELDKTAWKDMEVLLDNSPRRIPKWYFNFNVFLVGILAVCLSCFFPVIIEDRVPPENLENPTHNPNKMLPNSSPEVQPENKKPAPEKKTKKKTPEQSLDYALLNTPKKTPAISNNIFTNKNNPYIFSQNNNFTNVVSQNDALDPDNNFTKINNNSITKNNPNHPVHAFPAIVKTDVAPLAENPINAPGIAMIVPAKKKATFGIIAGGGLHLMDNTFAQPATASIATGGFIQLPVKGRWSVKAEGIIRKDIVTKNNNPVSQEFPEKISNSKNNLAVAVPVLASYKLTPNKSLEAGLVTTYNPNAKMTITGSNDTNPDSITLGIAVGLEQQVNSKLAVNVRYTKNLSSPSSLKPDSDLLLSARYLF